MASLVTTGLSTSLDGFIAGPEDRVGQPFGVGGERLFDWLSDGDTQSRHYPAFKMSAASARAFDEFADRVGAVIAGRRTYDIARAWGGRGPLPGAPLFVMTHEPPAEVPAGEPRDRPYTFVRDGIEAAVAQARAVAGEKDVSLMGASVVQQALRIGLLDELTIQLVPVLLGGGVRLLEAGVPAGTELEVVNVVDAPGVTHLTYRVPSR
jgi:dihydrofolate reductase